MDLTEHDILEDYRRGLLSEDEAQAMLLYAWMARSPAPLPPDQPATCLRCGAPCVWRGQPNEKQLIDLNTGERHVFSCLLADQANERET
jgi:hypothetical protein